MYAAHAVYGKSGSPVYRAFARNLSWTKPAVGHPTQHSWLPAATSAAKREQLGPPAPPQLVCADSQGETQELLGMWKC